MLLSIVATLVLLGLLIFVHESGHFIVARLNKVKVEKFSFGFGPKLFGFTKGDTEYRISLIPLGGYVKMLGENPDECTENAIPSSESFVGKQWWQKALIAVGGPAANYIFAVLLLTFTFIIGIKINDQEPIIGRIGLTAPVALLQLETGDRIIRMNGRSVTEWTQVLQATYHSKEATHTMHVVRGNDTLQIAYPALSLSEFNEQVKPFAPPVIGEVLYGLPAHQAGLKAGDRVQTINGEKIEDWYELYDRISTHYNQPVTVEYMRDGLIHASEITPQLNPDSQPPTGIIGISQKLPIQRVERSGIFKSIVLGATSSIAMISQYYKGFVSLLRQPSEFGKNIGGPVMIAALSGAQAKLGISNFFSFMAMISIILMIMNLLPIPILDGGMILFSAIEGALGKPLKTSIQALLQTIGLMIIFLLMFFAFYNDISRVVTRQVSVHHHNTQEHVSQ